MLTAVILTLTLGVIWTGLLAGGAVVASRGLRGRHVDNLPRCRRCGYNVGSRPHHAYRCPECGANLQLLGSIRLGTRAMHGPHVTLGLVLLLIGLSPIGILVWRAMPRAIPIAVAVPARPVVPAPAARKRGWNPSVVARSERLARARLAAGDSTVDSTVDAKTLRGSAMSLTPVVAAAGPFDPSVVHEFIARPPAAAPYMNDSGAFTAYRASAGTALFTIDPLPKMPSGSEAPTEPPARTRWPSIAAGTHLSTNPWGGSFGTGVIFGSGSVFATRPPGSAAPLAGPVVNAGSLLNGRLVQPPVMLGGGLPGLLSGGYSADWRATAPPRTGGAARALDANGLPITLPGGYRGAVVPRPGVGNGLRLTSPVPGAAALPGVPPG